MQQRTREKEADESNQRKFDVGVQRKTTGRPLRLGSIDFLILHSDF